MSNKTKKWKVTSHENHSCDGVAPQDRQQRKRSYKGSVVLETTPEFRSMYKPAGRGKDTKALVEAVAAGNTGMQMGKSTANRVVHQLLGHDVMDYIWDYAHLPDFIEKAKEHDPSGCYYFESVPLGMIEGVQSLYRVIWINGGVVTGFAQGNDFMGLFIFDGAHLGTPFGGCLLQVVAQDAGHHIVPLARAIVPIENTENAKIGRAHV